MSIIGGAHGDMQIVRAPNVGLLSPPSSGHLPPAAKITLAPILHLLSLSNPKPNLALNITNPVIVNSNPLDFK